MKITRNKILTVGNIITRMTTHVLHIAHHIANKKFNSFIFLLRVAPRTKTDWTVPEAWITTEARIVRVLLHCMIRIFITRADWIDGRAITEMKTCLYRAKTCLITISTSRTRPSLSGDFWRGISTRTRKCKSEICLTS